MDNLLKFLGIRLSILRDFSDQAGGHGLGDYIPHICIYKGKDRRYMNTKNIQWIYIHPIHTYDILNDPWNSEAIERKIVKTRLF